MIFDPFVTTKQVDAAGGIGLTVVRQIVDRLGGSIQRAQQARRGLGVHGRAAGPPSRAAASESRTASVEHDGFPRLRRERRDRSFPGAAAARRGTRSRRRQPRGTHERTAQTFAGSIGDLPDRVRPLPHADAFSVSGPLDAFARWFAENSATSRARMVAIGSLSARRKSDRSIRTSVSSLRASPTPSTRSPRRRTRAIAPSPYCARALIYGAGLDRSLTPIVRFAQPLARVSDVIGAHGLRQPVHADDLADACMPAAAEPCWRGASTMSAEASAFRSTRCSRACAHRSPLRRLPLPVPLALARAGAGLARRARTFSAASAAALQRMNEDLVGRPCARRSPTSAGRRAISGHAPRTGRRRRSPERSLPGDRVVRCIIPFAKGPFSRRCNVANARLNRLRCLVSARSEGATMQVRLITAAAVASSLLIVCTVRDARAYDYTAPVPFHAVASFDPSAGVVPFPTNLLLSAAPI